MSRGTGEGHRPTPGRVGPDGRRLPGEVSRMLPQALVLVAVCLLPLLSVQGCGPASDSADAAAPSGWGSADSWVRPATGLPDPADFVSGVDNPYWPLPPGARWVYEGETADGLERIEVVVLDETRTVAGIECVVVRDTVSLDGELIEDTYDWYAQDKDGNVWYMGEDSKEYEGGQASSTAGSWEAGVDGALPGVKVWATPRVGDAPYYQEYYQGEAEDLGRDVALDGTASVAFGDYADLLVVEEWTPLEPEVVERKYYAAGVGTVKEEMTRGGSEVVELIQFVRP